jgi:hypothetical protein
VIPKSRNRFSEKIFAHPEISHECVATRITHERPEEVSRNANDFFEFILLIVSRLFSSRSLCVIILDRNARSFFIEVRRRWRFSFAA